MVFAPPKIFERFWQFERARQTILGEWPLLSGERIRFFVFSAWEASFPGPEGNNFPFAPRKTYKTAMKPPLGNQGLGMAKVLAK